MYYDESLGCIRVATAGYIQGTFIPIIIWRDLEFKPLAREAQAASAGQGSSEVTWEDLEQRVYVQPEDRAKLNPADLADPEYLEASIERARQAALDGTSTFIPVRMDAISVDGRIPRNTPVSLLFNQVPESHFGAGMRVAWKRVPRFPNRQRSGSTSWSAIQPGNYSMTFVELSDPQDPVQISVPELVITGIDFAQAASDGYTGEGMIVQVIQIIRYNNGGDGAGPNGLRVVHSVG